MPSLTPLHETYCRWDRTPPNQADMLEGLAQLMSINLLSLKDLLQPIQINSLFKVFGFNQKQSQYLISNPVLQRSVQYAAQCVESSGRHFIAPALRLLNQRMPILNDRTLTSSQHALVSSINGILGNYLIQQHNPIALPMILYDHYGQPQQGELAGRVVIMVHGLCMNHLCWTQNHFGGIGEKLLAQRDCNIMLYLSYNSGRRISANGKSLSLLLEELIEKNPRISSIDLIGHSMGGLICRSALFYGKQDLLQWMQKTRNLVCIASPHHGAVLERLGYMLHDRLGRLPLLSGVGRLTAIRSDGILDLRYGSVRDDDWEHLSQRVGNKDDSRKPAPIPGSINCFLVAGSIETRPNQSKTLESIGDYLVSVKSALGEHSNVKFNLNVPESHKAIFYGLNHMELHCNTAVAEQIARWLYPDPIHSEDSIIEEISEDAHEHYHHRSMYALQGIAET